VLIKSQKIAYRRWTACLVMLTVLSLSSCTKKSGDTTASNSSTQPAAQSSSPASTTASKTPTTTASSESTPTASDQSTSTASGKSTTKVLPKASSRKTLSPEAEKLGVKPKGTDCPSEAPVKGNLNKGKQIYHESKEASYKQVKPEICFADVATAQKAGFRAAKASK